MAVIDLSAEVSLEQRLSDAALRCIARWGVAKTTLDDVAREAGCSRATVYRTFPGGKDALLSAVGRAEVERFFAGLDAAVAGIDDLEDLLVVGMSYAARSLHTNPALLFLLAHEPEFVLPRISFGHMAEVLDAVSLHTSCHLVPFVGADEAPRAAEWVVRIVFSYSIGPTEGVEMLDPDSVRRLVRDFVLPGLRPFLNSRGGSTS
jgi:AcrR family transcriptional regulator